MQLWIYNSVSRQSKQSHCLKAAQYKGGMDNREGELQQQQIEY